MNGKGARGCYKRESVKGVAEWGVGEKGVQKVVGKRSGGWGQRMLLGVSCRGLQKIRKR